MFSRKAVFEFEKQEGQDIEELELSLIDGGLEEIEENDGMLYAYADYTNFGDLSKVLDDLEIEIKKATLKRIPTSPVEFSEEQLDEIPYDPLNR